MRRGLVGDDVDERPSPAPAARDGARGSRAAPRQRCRGGRSTARAARRAPRGPARARGRGRAPGRRGSGVSRRRSMRCWSHSTQIATPSFIVTASGWAPPMPPSPAVTRDGAGERAPEPLVGDGGERLEGALEDPLGADVDPRAGRHLAVHRQPEVLEPAELLPVGPVADQVGVGDQHARRPRVGAHHADGLAGLHEQRLVVLERRAGCGRWRRTPPSCARPCRCRRRRRGPRGARRCRGRGCSSASAAAPRSATTSRSARCRWRRGWAGGGCREERPWSCPHENAAASAPERGRPGSQSVIRDCPLRSDALSGRCCGRAPRPAQSSSARHG